jgi:hypothetical protein
MRRAIHASLKIGVWWWVHSSMCVEEIKIRDATTFKRRLLSPRFATICAKGATSRVQVLSGDARITSKGK